MKTFKIKVIIHDTVIEEVITALQVNSSNPGYYEFLQINAKRSYYPIDKTIITEI